jgi:hypothetical protein
MKTVSGAPSIAWRDRMIWPGTGEIKSYGGAATPPYQSWVGRTCVSRRSQAKAGRSAVNGANQHSEVRAPNCPNASESTSEFVS